MMVNQGEPNLDTRYVRFSVSSSMI